MERIRLRNFLLMLMFIAEAVTCDSTSNGSTTVTDLEKATHFENSTTSSNSTIAEKALTATVQTTATQNKTSTVQTPVLPTTTDVCGLSLVSLSELSPSKTQKCKCSGYDEKVDCSYLDVTTLPKLISFPQTARDVNFAGNKIENIAEDTFYNGRYVQTLDLSHNRIDFISIVAFKAFKSLKRLDLSHNKVWNIPVKSFEGLISLKVLNLGFNDLAVLSSDLFSAIPNLTELDLESNPLLELEPKLFEHLKYLEKLNLGATSLKVVPDHLFVFTPHLKILDLSNNQLTEVPTDALRFLKHLTSLDLSGNPMSIIGEEAFIGLPSLVLLYLDRMPLLTKIDKYALGNLQNLQELHCSYNFLLSEIDEKAFVKKSDNRKVELTQLFLRQDSFASLSKDILNWNENVELHISDNPLSCDCKTEWMIHLSIKNDFQKHAKCLTPSHYQDLTLDKLKDEELSCGLELSEIVMIVLSSVIFLLILALIIAFLVWRRHYAGYKRPYFRVSKRKNVELDDGI